MKEHQTRRTRVGVGGDAEMGLMKPTVFAKTVELKRLEGCEAFAACGALKALPKT